MNNKKVILPLLMNLKNQIRFTIGLILLLMLTVWATFVFIVEPEHQVSSQLLIQESVPVMPHLAVENNQMDAQTLEAYAAFIKSTEVLELVKENLGLKMSISQLRERVDISYSDHSPVLAILVSSGSTQQAIEIADTLAFTFQNAVKKLIKSRQCHNYCAGIFTGWKCRSEWEYPNVRANDSGGLWLCFKCFFSIVVNALKTASNAKQRNIRKKENQLQTVFK